MARHLSRCGSYRLGRQYVKYAQLIPQQQHPPVQSRAPRSSRFDKPRHHAPPLTPASLLPHSYLAHTSRTCLSPISHSYLGHISAISRPYLAHISPISRLSASAAPPRAQVVVGVHEINPAREDACVQRRAPAQVIVHPLWNPGGWSRRNVRPTVSPEGMNNDLALIRLSRPAEYPAIEDLDNGTTAISDPGAWVTVAGWGTTSSGGESPPVAHHVQVPNRFQKHSLYLHISTAHTHTLCKIPSHLTPKHPNPTS